MQGNTIAEATRRKAAAAPSAFVTTVAAALFGGELPPESFGGEPLARGERLTDCTVFCCIAGSKLSGTMSASPKAAAGPPPPPDVDRETDILQFAKVSAAL